MSPGGRKVRWVELVDVPCAGKRLTSGAFSGPARSITLGVRVEGSDELLDFHEYRLSDHDWNRAGWVRFVGRGPKPQGTSTPRDMRPVWMFNRTDESAPGAASPCQQ